MQHCTHHISPSASVLTIDRGNSRTKLVVYRDRQPLDTLTVNPGDDIEAATDLIARYHVKAVASCSVARPIDDLAHIVRQFTTREMFTLSVDSPLPLSVDYAPSLGVDRLAAAIGAQALHPGLNLLIVDAGSALTCDYVSADSRFVGGNISPGLSMRLSALNHFTARLPQLDIKGDTPLWGYDTPSAMRAGALNGVVAEVLYYRSMLPHDTVIVITGGDADTIADAIPMRLTKSPALVNYGLLIALEYQLNHQSA